MRVEDCCQVNAAQWFDAHFPKKWMGFPIAANMGRDATKSSGIDEVKELRFAAFSVESDYTVCMLYFWNRTAAEEKLAGHP
jgi:hypothetical protein